MKYYKITLVLEAYTHLEAEVVAKEIVENKDSVFDIHTKNIEEMTNGEVLDFFDKTKDELEAET